VWMLENSVYSILSPEGFAAILWKDGKRVQEAAEVMKITAADLMELGVIDRIIPEDGNASRENMDWLAVDLKENITGFLREYAEKTPDQIVEERYQRFRRM
ncbi:MAG: acetyl-CoA carboxylase carboxyl transferase subunit alpha, partial [Clostridiales bacterium]|nr:acetyl-CoA carboxylase carboxyl transferase subunit alpha [Clostridiales bacterium]